MRKKQFFASHAKSSAMLVSLAVHGILIVIAVTFVAVSVIPREEPAFEPKKVTRPKMPPKKLKVPVNVKKRKPRPRLRKRIVTERKSVNIQMPEITGVAGGLGNMGGDGLGSLGFDIDIGDLFGSNTSMGNELAGTFYDLKQTRDGKPIEMTDELYMNALARFAKGWQTSRLDGFFKAPKEKYATFFMIPKMGADAAPKAYGVSDVVQPRHWAAYYTGHFAAPETGHYRFCGYGDDVLLVRVKKRLVLDASHNVWEGRVTNWISDDDNSRKYPMGRDHMIIGDWMKLTKGEPMEIEIFLGECPGGGFACQLMIEQKGKEYQQVSYTTPEGTATRPVLPVFKTKEIPRELHEQMRINPNEVTLGGPTFGVVE